MTDSFVFYRSFLEAVEDLPGDQAKTVILAIARYALDDIEPDTSDPFVKMGFTLMRPQIDANKRRRENGKRGGAHIGNSNAKTSKVKADSTDNKLKQPKTTKAAKSEPNVNGNDNANGNVNGNVKALGAEPDNSAPPVITLPLNDGTLFLITQSMVDKWKSLYPAVDVMQELRKMSGWLDANPTRRKTRTGVLRFIAAWLSKEQDKGPQHGAQRPTAAKQTRFHNFEERPDDDLDALMAQKMRERLNA